MRRNNNLKGSNMVKLTRELTGGNPEIGETFLQV